ncbi:Ig-like domain-containing protein [Paenibacillus planticolens]|uniref:Bacterial Ig-like domain-containing protein n=1 Tax=Paenibacillus planticolens TaxID=2654976 RepID=A0ABX1ZS80_9BACL|nr:Ig-like domain-containing protein [Paenibacillus planticolens]NOV02651.1 hypothetical protein [Paenibacillus planticolens]
MKRMNVYKLRWIGVVFSVALLVNLYQPAAYALTTVGQVITGPASSSYGQPVQFTSVVTDSAPGGTVPIGSVIFYDGETPIGVPQVLAASEPTVVLKSSGSAPELAGKKFTCSNCPVIQWGGLTYWAYSDTDNNLKVYLYAFDANNSLKKSWEFSGNRYVTDIKVDNIAKTVTLIGQDNVPTTRTWEQLENFNAHASVSVSNLGVGTHTITALYAGDGLHDSKSTTFIHKVDKIQTNTSLSSNAGLIYVGEPVTFAATVTNSNGSPAASSGTVTFQEGSNVLGTEMVNGSGVAAFTTSVLPVNGYSVTATYNGDVQHSPSTSSSLSQFVLGIPTEVTVAASPGSTTYGNSVTLTATVANGLPSLLGPTGTVTFKEGSTVLGTGTLSSGIATLTTPILNVGSHSITAHYGGSLTHVANSSSSAPVVINPIPTSATLTVTGGTGDSSSYGTSLTLTATVANTNGSPIAPGGTVTFKDGTTALGTTPLSGGTAVWTLPGSLATGSHAFKAEYSGDENHAISPPAVAGHTVNKAATAVVIEPPISIVVGGTAVLKANVVNTTNNSMKPTGTVTFKKDGEIISPSRALDSNGAVTITVPGLQAGDRFIKAEYSGDDNHFASVSSEVTQPVAKAQTEVQLSLPSGTSYYRHSAVFQVQVNGSAGTIPGGTISLIETRGGEPVVLAHNLALDSSGTVTWNTSDLQVGVHRLTAHYNGDDTYLTGDSPEKPFTVEAIPTVIALSPSEAEAAYGHLLNFTVQVSNTDAVQDTVRPTGSVIFKIHDQQVAEIPLDGNGQAVYTTDALTVGAWTVEAYYNPDIQHSASEHASAAVIINKASTATTVQSSGGIVVGEAATFTAKVGNTSNAGILPTGTVTFKNNGIALLSPVTLDSNGTAVLTVPNLPVGDLSITAEYSGDGNHLAGASSPITQPVSKAPVTVQLSLTPQTGESVYGHAVTVTVQVVNAGSGGFVPMGTVALSSTGSFSHWPSELLLTNGTATWDTQQLDIGTHAIVARYSGDNEHLAGVSTSSSLRIKPIPVTVKMTASVTEAVYYGSPITFTAHVTNTNEEPQIPVGHIVFTGGNLPDTTMNLDSAGFASITTAALLPGTYSIQAAYVPDLLHEANKSQPITQAVKPNTQGTVLILNHPSATFQLGETIKFSVSVGDLIGDLTQPGYISLRENGAERARVTTDVYGNAEISLSDLSSGTHRFTALYQREGITDGTESQEVTVVVQPAFTQLFLASEDYGKMLPTSTPWISAVVNGASPSFTFRPISAEAGTGIQLTRVNPQNGELGSAIELTNGQSAPVQLAEGLNRFQLKQVSLDGTASTKHIVSLFYQNGDKVWDISSVLAATLSGYDMDGNGTFDKADVIELLKLIEPLSAGNNRP